jgi:alginate O-acetyltransferase complex protein AlgI
MTLTHILVFSGIALLTCWVIPARWRLWVMLTSSLLAVYWLQPSTPIRNLDFWLPTASIVLVIFTWAIVRQAGEGERKLNLLAVVVVAGVVMLVAMGRYLGPFCCLIPTRPPAISTVLLFLAGVAVILLIVAAMKHQQHRLAWVAIIAILGIFIVLKSAYFSAWLSAGLRTFTGQDASLAGANDLLWLGFSFLAFRLLHVLLDFQKGRLPAYSLAELATYALFYPAYTAGPIDRSERFIGDLRQPVATPAENTVAGSQRIIIGLFKKFVIADSLVIFSLNAQNASQTSSPFWMWVLLYAYTLRIYFDFAGYTDIALGLARFLGIKLPENFNSPYLKTNLTNFWNSWHITLAQWFRAYFFNPLTRALRSNPRQPPTWMIILLGQLGTMLLIGLWHGITWNFAIWGLWHGLGLFINNRWSEFIRPRMVNLDQRPAYRRLLSFGGWFITFQYVALGWVWFALPTINLSLEVFQELFGL